MALDTSALPMEAHILLKQFPEFQPFRFNDSGANGYVLIGRHNVLQRDVALKIYFHAKNDMEQEPALIAAINHENVLKVLDARKLCDECSFFMMPYANYGDLSDYLKGYNLSVSLSHKLLCQLLSGLSALHGEPNRLVHRDLKPQNLLVHDDKLLIADFGSVRQISNTTGKATVSKHSILYRPSEAFGIDPYFNFSSDCYQAGMIGYLLFGGALNDDLKTHMRASELKELAKLEHNNADNYDISKFIDSCIQKRIESGALFDWDSMPLFVPKRIVKCLKKAVSKQGRYMNVSEFLAGLAAARSPMPNWMVVEGNDWQLRGWKGNDYLLTDIGADVKVRKRSTGNQKYVTDNKLSGGEIKQVFNRFALHLGLP